jgi:hypothetical protein
LSLHTPVMEVAGRKKYSCKYPGCNNWYYVNISGGFVNKHFFKFPKDVHQIQLWKAACKVDEVHNIDNWRICEDHFEAKSFVNERKERLNTGCLPKPYELSSCDLQVQDHTYCGTGEVFSYFCLFFLQCIGCVKKDRRIATKQATQFRVIT